MKLLLDLQAIQGSSGRRGIGRYSFELARALAQTAGGHDLFVALSNRLSIPWERIEDLKREGVPPGQVITIPLPGRSAEVDPANAHRAFVANRIWADALAGLKPDVVHVSSLFEGFYDEIATPFPAQGGTIPTSLTLYDLIPLLRPSAYLVRPDVRAWYERKLAQLKSADHLLAISRSSRDEAIEHLGMAEDRISVIDAGISDFFRSVAGDREMLEEVRGKFGLRPFVLYTGGIDPRKNVEGAIAGFAALPERLRDAHQLAIVCAISAEDRRRLARLAAQAGLADRHVIFTGYVSDVDLRALYSACAAFIFTSLHEGFGLPVIEAMACGAPALASNNSSLPDIVGREDALFDPEDRLSVAAKLAEVLTDPGFAASLRESGAARAAQFTWRRSATLAWAAFEAMHEKAAAHPSVPVKVPASRPRIAYVSPLPPIRSGIADYSAELLPALAEHFDIDVVVDQPTVSDEWIAANLPIRDVAAFERAGAEYDAVLYNIGNSEYHTHMFDLIERWPGVVILHDFFLSDVFRVLGHKVGREAWFRRLRFSHGLPAVARYPALSLSAEAMRLYPCTLSVLEYATAMITHSTHAAAMAEERFGPNTLGETVVLPFPRRAGPVGERRRARERLGLPADAVLFCSFGFAMEFKLPHRILDAWPEVLAASDGRARLVFVGDCPENPYGEALRARIAASEGVSVTGFAERTVYAEYLAACDVAVQLRTASRGETSAAVLDCFAYGVPVIANAHGSFAELPEAATVKVPDAFADAELAAAMAGLARSRERREQMGAAALAHLRALHDPAVVAAGIAGAIERAGTGRAGRLNALVREIAASPLGADPAELVPVAHALTNNRATRRPPEMLVDVSVIARTDAGSGIQRVVRNLVRNIVLGEMGALRPEVVRVGAEITYANDFATRFFAIDTLGASDLPAELVRGGVFLGLDLNQDITRPVLETLRQRNIRIYVVIYDLLPALMPEHFAGATPRFVNWLRLVCEMADGLICISHAVASELTGWLDRERPRKDGDLPIGVFRLGSDLDGMPLGEPSPVDRAIIESACARPTILMVGTIEPRKGYWQALKAFALLRQRGIDANLVIVGKAGWAVEPVLKLLRGLTLEQDGVFWIETASDATLRQLYERSSLLLAASAGEGFGLPLAEAAHFGLPVLARDIPVFREVAGEGATFFFGEAPEALADALEQWFRSPVARGAGTELVGWSESARQIVDLINGKGWQYRWSPGEDTAEDRPG